MRSRYEEEEARRDREREDRRIKDVRVAASRSNRHKLPYRCLVRQTVPKMRTRYGTGRQDGNGSWTQCYGWHNINAVPVGVDVTRAMPRAIPLSVPGQRYIVPITRAGTSYPPHYE
ncbi:hypothetical protein KIPB_008550, partial [Kipferlia bialata]|eukprot:g8550.t1